jgi:hypothetical protein
MNSRSKCEKMTWHMPHPLPRWAYLSLIFGIPWNSSLDGALVSETRCRAPSLIRCRPQKSAKAFNQAFSW